MIDKHQARMLASDYVMKECQSHDPENPTIINDTLTIERPYGWIFFYDSKKYIETKEPIYALFGNCPIVIEKADGVMSFLGTALNLSEEIIDFEKRRFGKTYELPEKLKNEKPAWS